ncbi:hypothetical protein [Nostoc sp. CHAB 5715]|uniref:hypothetical protein n=1 Tax=Nostoc sp. CHAB 5715 TaxID=2780400 RepID=UPI001E3CAA10|nr:hypothetical protein [Nostoc sp. CHAB 5715]MCC5625057.1 hypothetical protein [Nostoc sp. CHAB 5715]
MPKRPKQNSDHAQRHNTPTIDNEAIAQLASRKILLPPVQHYLSPLAPNFNYFTPCATLYPKSFVSKPFET